MWTSQSKFLKIIHNLKPQLNDLLSKFNFQQISSFLFLPKLVLIVSLGITSYFSYSTHKGIQVGAKKSFEFAVNDAILDLNHGMKDYELLLHSLEGFHYGCEFVSKDQWKIFLENVHLSKNYPGIHGAGFSLYIPKNKLKEHIAQYSKQLDKYEFKPSGQREEYSSVIYLEPLDAQNKRAIGFDMLSEQKRRDAMKKAIDSGLPQMTKSVPLVQENNISTQAKFIMYLPIYKKSYTWQTVLERNDDIYGFIFVPFGANDLINSMFDEKNDPVAMKILDGPQNAPGSSLLYDGILKTSANHVDSPMFTCSKDVALYGQTWSIYFQTQKVFEKGVDNSKPIIMFVSGIIISLLLTLMTNILISMREKSRKIAESMTGQYLIANDRLLEKIQELNMLNSHLNDKVEEEVLQQMEAKEKEYQTRTHLAAIIEFSQDAIVSKDLDGRIISWNEGACQLFGYTAQEIIGQSMKVLFPKEQSNEEETILHVLQQGRQLKQFESRRIHKDGTSLTVLVSVSPIINNSGEVTAISSIIRDISERKKWEMELKTAQQNALAASRAKSDFLAVMSHEIRTPMNAILGMAHLLSKSTLTKKYKGFVNTIISSSNILLSIINNILDFSKIEAGKMEIDNIRFNLDEVFDEIEEMFTVRVHEKNLGFSFIFDDKTPTYLIGDKLRLKQILLNLLGNALKFTDKGSISVNIKNISSDPINALLEFGIQDSGIGMAQHQMHKLFMPFEQADTSTTRLYGGTGLGLAICKQLTELMGGEIGVQSELGKGSYFYVRIPFVCLDEQPEVFHIAKNAVADKRLIFIDDHEEYAGKLLGLFDSLKMDVDYSAMDKYQDEARKYTNYDLAIIGFDDVSTGIKALKYIINSKVVELNNVVLLSSYPVDIKKLEVDEEQISAIIKRAISRSTLLDVLLSTIGQSGYSKLQNFGLEDIDESSQTILENINILVVDDNTINLEVMNELLLAYGAKPTTVASGQGALDTLNSARDKFDVVLMDIQMPQMDGFEATRRIRDSGFATLPILALSADVTKQTIQKTGSSSFDGYLSKPVNPAQLLRSILDCLNIKANLNGKGEEIQNNSNPFEFGSIDAKKGLALVAGNIQAYTKVLKKFALTYSDSFEKLEDFLSNNKFEDAGHLVHTIKGVSGNLGMTKLFLALDVLDKAIANKDVSEEFGAKFYQELQGCLSDIDSLDLQLFEEASPSDSSMYITDEQIQNLLDKVASFQVSAKEEAGEIYKTLRDDDACKQSLLQVIDRLEGYDFTQAKALLENMTNQIQTKSNS
jgi:PAS domain S-box-containing protein